MAIQREHWISPDEYLEYVLISAQHQEVETYRRQGDIWVYQQFGSGQKVRLASIDLTIPLADLYRLTDIPEQVPDE